MARVSGAWHAPLVPDANANADERSLGHCVEMSMAWKWRWNHRRPRLGMRADGCTYSRSRNEGYASGSGIEHGRWPYCSRTDYNASVLPPSLSASLRLAPKEMDHSEQLAYKETPGDPQRARRGGHSMDTIA